MKHQRYLRQYYDRFGTTPGVSIAFVTDSNSAYLIEAIREALRRGSPLTPAEESALERRTFANYYERREKGERVLLAPKPRPNPIYPK